MGRLEADHRGRLFWNGEELATLLRLTFRQGLAAAVVTVATAIMGVESAIRIFDRRWHPGPNGTGRTRGKWKWAAAGCALLIASCNGQQQARCYRIVESMGSEDNGRFMMDVPCPPGKTGILRNES